MNEPFVHIVPDATPVQRLSDYAVGVFAAIPTRKGIKKAIKKGWLQHNGQVGQTGNWVQTGDRLELQVPERSVKIFDYPIEVVYQDNDIAVVVKPAGLVVSGHQFRTLENALPQHLEPSSRIDKLEHFRAAHRLDHATSGLLIVAKTRSARTRLGEQFANRQVQKTYAAIVQGKPSSEEGIITDPVDGKMAQTEYQVLQSVRSLKTGFLTFVALRPVTGRTHQLRRHMAGLGCPILGDKLYHGDRPLLRGKGLFLAATTLIFQHPVTQNALHFIIEPPTKFTYRLAQEKRRWLAKKG